MDTLPVKDAGTRGNADFGAGIEPAKLEHYRAVWRAMDENGDDPLSYATLCPSKYCAERIYVGTKDELKRVACGELTCGYCLAHGGKSRRLAYYESVCPIQFREGAEKTVVSKLKQYGGALKLWGAGKLPEKSLYFYGQTGARKSRTLWKLIEDKVLSSSLSFRVLIGGGFREALLSVQGDYWRVNAVKDTLAGVDLLCFDDFAQDVLTETMRADLWNVLERRFNGGKKTIFLSNISQHEFAKKLGGDYVATSMVRRIRDYTKSLEFKL